MKIKCPYCGKMKPEGRSIKHHILACPKRDEPVEPEQPKRPAANHPELPFPEQIGDS